MKTFLKNVPLVGYFLKILKELLWLPKRMRELDAQIDTLETRSGKIDQIDNAVVEIKHALNQNTFKAEKTTTIESTRLADNHDLDQFYIDFENKFRGGEEEIIQRLSVYLPYLTQAGLDYKKHPVLDIGCGRGEFLALLKNHAINAEGLDINETMAEHNKKKGLNVHLGDALSFLREQKTESFGAITGFHFVEHIPFGELVKIFDECYRVLKRGGVVIFETPNPENILVGSCDFYNDPSHLNPIPPEVLSFTLGHRGFEKREILRMRPVKDKIDLTDPVLKEMANRVFGPADYSVIAWK